MRCARRTSPYIRRVDVGGRCLRVAMARSCVGVFAGLVGVVLACGGCQRYAAKPLYVDAMVRAWQQRSVTTARAPILGGKPQGSFDLHDGVTLAEAVWVARTVHPQLRIAQARLLVARAGRVAAGRWADPQLSGTTRRNSAVVPSAWMLDWTLSFEIPLSSRYAALSARARAAAIAAGHDADLRAWTIELALRQAWRRWSAAQRRQTILRRHVRAFAPLLQQARALARAGELNAARIGVVEVAFFDAERRVRRADMAARLGRRAVLRAMGLRPTAPAHLLATPDPVLAPASIRAPGRAAASQASSAAAAAATAAKVRSNHPAFLAAQARYEVAEQRLRAAVAQQWPSLRIGPSLERADGGWALGLGLSLPITLLRGSVRAMAQARAKRTLAGRRLAWVMERLLADASDAHQRVAMNTANLRALRSHLIPAVDKMLTRLTRLAAAGEIDLLLLQVALNRARLVRIAEIDAELRLELARLAVRRVVAAPPPSAVAAVSHTSAKPTRRQP